MIAFVLDSGGAIINTIVLDDGAQWSPPNGCAVAFGDYGIGGKLIDGVYAPPPPTEDVQPKRDLVPNVAAWL